MIKKLFNVLEFELYFFVFVKFGVPDSTVGWTFKLKEKFNIRIAKNPGPSVVFADIAFYISKKTTIF